MVSILVRWKCESLSRVRLFMTPWTVTHQAPLSMEFSWRRKWQPTPVFLPGEFHGRRSPVGYSPRGRKRWTQLSNRHRLSGTVSVLFTAEFPGFNKLGTQAGTQKGLVAWMMSPFTRLLRENTIQVLAYTRASVNSAWKGSKIILGGGHKLKFRLSSFNCCFVTLCLWERTDTTQKGQSSSSVLNCK